jgi:hypothetical protein
LQLLQPEYEQLFSLENLVVTYVLRGQDDNRRKSWINFNPHLARNREKRRFGSERSLVRNGLTAPSTSVISRGMKVC